MYSRRLLMNKTVKKIIAIVLTTVISAGMFGIIGSAASCNCSNTPIIYVFGKQEIYTYNDDGTPVLDSNGKLVKSTAFDLDVGTITKEVLPLFAKAYLTDDEAAWEEFSETFLNATLPLYENKGVDANGEIIDPVHYHMSDEAVSSLGSFQGTTHGWHMGWNNHFYYDYRLPVSVSAAQLQEFVELVEANTGHDNVVIVTRCQGASIVNAWLKLCQEEKNYSDIKKIAYIDPTYNGVDSAEYFLSGELPVNTDALYRYLSLYDLKDLLGEEYGQLASLLIDSLYEGYGIKLTASTVGKIYDKVSDRVIAPLMREYYGKCGGMLACINDNFEQAIDYLYPTDELKEEYKVIIDDAIYIHDNVTSKCTELLKEAQAAGVDIGIFVEYGYQSTPLGEEADYVGDKMTSVANQSLGATVAKVTGTLSEDYIAAQTEAGLGRYISADKQIDASTGAFPDTTWYIKNLDHAFPEILHVLIVNFFRNGWNVNSSAAFPQFVNYHNTEDGNGSFEPLQEVNDNDIVYSNLSGVEEGEATTIITNKVFSKLSEYIKLFIDFIKQLVAMFKNLK